MSNGNHDGDDSARDEDLVRDAAALPRAIQPPRDLWAGVAARIEVKRRRAIVLRRTVTATSALLAAAAVFLVLRTARPPVVTNGITPAPIASERVLPKRSPIRDVRGAPIVPEEDSYHAAIAALAPVFDERVKTLSDVDAEAIGKSLDAIGDAIEATRASLEDAPDDADLRAELDDEYEQEIQTMSDVLDWTTRS